MDGIIGVILKNPIWIWIEMGCGCGGLGGLSDAEGITEGLLFGGETTSSVSGGSSEAIGERIGGNRTSQTGSPIEITRSGRDVYKGGIVPRGR